MIFCGTAVQAGAGPRYRDPNVTGAGTGFGARKGELCQGAAGCRLQAQCGAGQTDRISTAGDNGPALLNDHLLRWSVSV